MAWGYHHCMIYKGMVYNAAWCTMRHDAPCGMIHNSPATWILWLLHVYFTAATAIELLLYCINTFLTGIGVSSSLLQAGMLSLWVLLQVDMFLVWNAMPTQLLHHSLAMHFSYLIPTISTFSCIIYFHYWPPTNMSNLFCPSPHPFTLHH